MPALILSSAGTPATMSAEPTEVHANATGRLLLGCLSLLLLGQVALWTVRRSEPPPEGPLVGELLPDVRVSPLGTDHDGPLSQILVRSRECSLVLISTSCPVCSRMRVDWPERFADWATGTHARIETIWLSEEGEGELALFVDGHDLAGVDHVLHAVGEERQLFRRLGMIGTPTVYLVDAEGRYRYGLLGDRFPPLDVVETACP